jgi:hypothetical protein
MEPSEAAPARALYSADLSALLPQVGLPAVHVDQRQREVSNLSSRGQDTAAAPIRSITERPLLSPSSYTHRLIGFSCERPSLAGRRRAYHVPPLSPCGLGRVSPPVARRLRWRSSEPPDLATYLLVQACQHLALVLCDDGYDPSPGLTLPHDPGSRAAAMLAVATWPHGCVAILADEATLFRRLRTSCDARPGRILRVAPQVMSLSPKCITVTATTSCRTRTTSSPAAAVGATLNPENGTCRRGQVQHFVRHALVATRGSTRRWKSLCGFCRATSASPP